MTAISRRRTATLRPSTFTWGVLVANIAVLVLVRNSCCTARTSSILSPVTNIFQCPDECTPFHVQKEYTEASMHRTHRWAMRSLREFINGDDGSQAVRRTRQRHQITFCASQFVCRHANEIKRNHRGLLCLALHNVYPTPLYVSMIVLMLSLFAPLPPIPLPHPAFFSFSRTAFSCTV